jgi:glyceraldehyde-3-phosphate dehydrogenase (NAD(P))
LPPIGDKLIRDELCPWLQAIVILETIYVIRTLTGTISNAEESIGKTDAALGIGLLAETQEKR